MPGGASTGSRSQQSGGLAPPQRVRAIPHPVGGPWTVQVSGRTRGSLDEALLRLAGARCAGAQTCDGGQHVFVGPSWNPEYRVHAIELDTEQPLAVAEAVASSIQAHSRPTRSRGAALAVRLRAGRSLA